LKTPKDNLLPGRFLAYADSCGDAMTYYILTEPTEKHKRSQVLMRSVVRTRRRKIGTDDEYVNDDPAAVPFTMSLAEHQQNLNDISSTEAVPILLPGEKIADGTTEPHLQQPTSPVTTPDDSEIFTDKNLSSDINATNNAESYQDILESTNKNLTGNMNFRKILEHFWDDGLLFFKAQYVDPVHGTTVLATPFPKLKQDEPISCAKYI